MQANGFRAQLRDKLTNILQFFWAMTYIFSLLYHCRLSVTKPRINSFLRGLKANEARDLPIGTAGFCWGGKFVTLLCWDDEFNRASSGERLTVCGYAAHPSRLAYPSDIEKIRLPYSCAAAEHDMVMSPADAKRTEEILKEKTVKGRDEGIEHEFVMYHGVHHGFAVR